MISEKAIPQGMDDDLWLELYDHEEVEEEESMSDRAERLNETRHQTRIDEGYYNQFDD